MKLFVSQSHLRSTFFPYISKLDTNETLNTLKHGTENISTKSPEFDTTVRKNVHKIVNSVSKADAQKYIDQHVNAIKNTESKKNETEQETNENDNTQQSVHPAKKEKRAKEPKLGFLQRAKTTIGTYTKLGAQYGALIMGTIAGLISIPYAAILVAGGGVGVIAALGVVALVALAGAIDGAINGAIIGAIVGLIKKVVEKKEQETESPSNQKH